MADLFTDIFKFAGSIANQALTPDNLRDYRHASKLFVDDQYRLMPKLGFLFHVFFDINPGAQTADIQNPNRDRELGMMVKSVSLPKFTVDTKKYNAYNRPNFAQSKIHYDALNITFHDDSADLIRNFWFDYYNYYYRDSDYSEPLYGQSHKYGATRPTDKWGFSPRNGVGQPYLKNIRIYSLHQKRFSEYVLVNPIIKSFKHGEHMQGQNETMQHDMTIEYESVLYYYGSVTSNTSSNVKGFIDLHYDKMPSPLTPAGGGTRSILGPGGLLETGDDVIGDLANGNYGSALFKGLKGVQNARNMNLKSAAIGELLALGTGVLRGNNPASSIFVPSLPSLGQDISTIGARLALGGLTSGGGIGGSGSWLAGAAGVGLTAFGIGESRSQEVTDASVYDTGESPQTPYDDWPAPDDSDVLVEWGSEDSTDVPEANYGDENLASATNQESINSPGDQLAIENNIDKTKQNMASLQSDINTQTQLRKAADASAARLDAMKNDLLQAGSSPSDPAVREIQRQINQQIEISATNDAVIDQLNADFSAFNNRLTNLNTQYNSLN